MRRYRTEAGGWLAEWGIDRGAPRILLVRHIGETALLVSAESTGSPDLAQLRERFPELGRLCDAIRHQYWSECLAPGARKRPG